MAEAGGKEGGPLPQILADQKTAAAASACRIITRYPKFLDLPPSLLTEVNQYFIDPLSSVRLYFDSIRDREAKYADVCMLLLQNAWNIIPLYCLTDIVQSNADNSYLENAFSDPSRHSVKKSEF